MGKSRNISQVLNDQGLIEAADLAPGVGTPEQGFIRNKIVNGGFDIWQRGTTVSSNVNDWTADRFFNTNSAMTWTRANNTLGGPCPYMCTLTGGGSDSRFRFSFEMPSTTSQGEFSVGSYWTLSLYTSLNIAGRTFNIGYAANPNGTTDTASTTGTWVALGDNRYSVTMQINAANTNNRAAMRFSGPFNGPVNEGVASISVTGVQFEAGSVATPFERRPIEVELALCQRYYEKSANNTKLIWTGDATTGNNYYATGLFAVSKRASPTFTGTITAGTGFSGGAPVDSDADISGWNIAAACNSTGARRYYTFGFTASAEL